ncbi:MULTISPECIES: IS701 family transposase [unclassified Streptomyces]|uniref:IS701 family transposase n=1 Tax=unclassified Streptomyces TaxID=2593676 RepID=UPI002E18A337|nr:MULTISPECIES: IS701 family transposase [unclassified Streptomyces]
MTSRLPCPPAPGPLEEYAARFDGVFATLAQRRGFRECLVGLLAPRDRNKTITCLAGAEPVDGAGGAAVQRLQFFVSESTWDSEKVNDRRLELLRANEATTPHDGGVIIIDDSGDRKDGTATAHVGRQWLGRLGKTDNGIVTVTTVWTDGRVYYPLHAQPYTPAHHFDRARNDPAFRTKPQISATLAVRGKEAGFACRAVVADCAYSTSDDWYLALRDAGLPYVVALRPHRGTWARADEPHTPIDAARALTGTDPDHPGDWTAIERRFRDGHTETWWAADAHLGGYGPDGPCRLVVATTDPGTLPEKATWYLATNLPHPEAAHATTSPHPPADLAEIVRIYGLRPWIEQSYKHIKDELGWADFQVRSDRAIRHHQTLVNCAFSFCWDQWFAPPGLLDVTAPEPCPAQTRERGLHITPPAPTSLLAQGITRRSVLAHPRHHPAPLVAGLDRQGPATRTPGTPRRRHHRQTP